MSLRIFVLSWTVLVTCRGIAGLGHPTKTTNRDEINAMAIGMDESESSSCHKLSLTLQAATLSIPNTNHLRITTRLYDGKYPGPTWHLQAGECYQVDFHNELESAPEDPTVFRHVNNQLSAPNETNLHFHGLHISEQEPSDDVLNVVVGPGESYTYTIRVPPDHMGGTHWLHAHRHSSSAVQVGGGAASPVIVTNKEESLPPAIQQAPEILFLVHPMDIFDMAKVTHNMGDTLWQVSGLEASSGGQALWITVNGQVRPQFHLPAGVWTRIRILWASWRKGSLDWRIQGGSNNDEDSTNCQVALLAKDGIYIRDFPRMVSILPLLPGARADVMVRCPQPNRSYVIMGQEGIPIATLRTVPAGTSNFTNPPALESWTPTYPDYLQDLRAEPPSTGCSCTTSLGQFRRDMNGLLFEPNAIFHQSSLGAVVERQLITRNHPYHQHVYPFQLMGDVSWRSSRDDSETDNFYKAGDWHDTIQAQDKEDMIAIRYRPTHYPGQLVVHCHRLIHEDEGMMAVEYVYDDDSRGCTCAQQSGTRHSASVGWVWFGSLCAWIILFC